MILHEHHVAQFEPIDEVFHGRAHVTTSSPDILDEGDLFRVDLQLLCQPQIIEFNTLLLEEDVLIGVVEDLNAQHDESRVVTTSQPDIIEIVEADTKLVANQWVPRKKGGKIIW